MYWRNARRTVAVLGALVAVGALVTPARAAVSAGASADCDADGHCVSGSAMAINGGASPLVEVQVIPDGTGVAVAVCEGSSNGATLMQISCSHGSVSKTMSFPGPVGAVPLQTTQARLERLPVCWQVTGYFPVILGTEHIVSTSGCAQLAV